MDSTQTHVSTSDQHGILVITVLDQRLTDEMQVADWQRQMGEAIRKSAPTGVVVDLKNVEYMTSVAVFPLIATRAVADELGIKLVLCNLSMAVLKVLTVAQLIVESRQHAKHLAMAENLDDALTAVST
jgi:anti-anti-sigma factor